MSIRDPDHPAPSESNQDGGVGVGEPLTAADQRWQKAAAKLEPARSLPEAWRARSQRSWAPVSLGRMAGPP
jgi:hypothetical protein